MKRNNDASVTVHVSCYACTVKCHVLWFNKAAICLHLCVKFWEEGRGAYI